MTAFPDRIRASLLPSFTLAKSAIPAALLLGFTGSLANAQIQNCPDPRAPSAVIGGISNSGWVVICAGTANDPGNPGAINASGFFYSSATTVSTGPGRVVNVADGLVSPGSTDAVNGGQLSSLAEATRFDLRRLDREQETGGARAAALAGIPQAITPGKGMIGVSVGGAGDTTAFAVGASKSFASPGIVAKAAMSFSTRTNDVSWNVGAGMEF